MLNIFLTLAG